MQTLLNKYSGKLIADGSAIPERIGFAAQDDQPVSAGDSRLSALALNILAEGGSLAVLVAQPPNPWSDFLIRRSPVQEAVIVPRDSETRTFLHDIPLIRCSERTAPPLSEIARLLEKRKGIIVEGLGIVATGAMTVEQAYINYSSVYHAVFVKYLQDLLRDGFTLPGEEEALLDFRLRHLKPLEMGGVVFREGPLQEQGEILDEIAQVGRYTVEMGLVDSFFGNISLFDGRTIYISQTGSSLDELTGCIDSVPMDGSSTAGITASSEYPAHRRVYEETDARVILHGHPKFSVVMSMECGDRECTIVDCWRECPRVRFIGDTPVVAGEIGAGGLAGSVPPVIAGSGKALVYGHGLFTTGRRDFAEAFRSMVEVENHCRDEYFRRLESR